MRRSPKATSARAKLRSTRCVSRRIWPEAHIALGPVQRGHDWDWTAADASFRRALELAPGDAQALRRAASLARILGRNDEALELIRKALALDPLSARTHRQVALIYLVRGPPGRSGGVVPARDRPRADRRAGHAFLAITRLMQGRAEEALRLAEAESHDVFRNVALAMIRHDMGSGQESDAALQALIDEFGWTAAYQIGEVYAYREEVDQAFEWLERALRTARPRRDVTQATDVPASAAWRSALERVARRDALGMKE